MTVSSQICKRIYQADGQNRQWAVDFAYLSAAELKVYVTDACGVQTDVTAHCMWDEVEQEMIYPTVASEQAPLPVGATVTVVRVTTPTQNLHLTQQGILDATALEGGFDKLTLHVQELAEQAGRSIKYPVSSNKTDADAQTFLAELQSTQTAALNGALESVSATKVQLQQALSDEQIARQQADAGLQSAIATKQNTLNAEGQQAVASGINAAKVASYDGHLLNTSNPHSVTKAQVGLGNADNTSDLAKPISTATQAALDGKQNTLTTAQQAAVDSGVTSSTVAQVQTNKENIAALDEELDENREWQKPADWIDIRSGALPNSVYFLVGHSADYTTYPTFTIHTNLSNTSNTYDVFVDGIKVATSNHNTDTTLNWQTLALASGYDVTYPSLLRTHIVRVTPSVSTDKLYHIKTTANTGLLWAHVTLADKTGINLNSFVKDAAHLEAITASTNRLFPDYGSTNGAPFYIFNSFASGCVSLKTIPIIDFSVTNNSNSVSRAFYDCSSLKTVSIANCKGMASGGAIEATFYKCASLTCINAENCDFQTNNSLYTFSKCASLKSLPEGLNFTNTQQVNDFLQEDASLQDTVLDCSLGKNINRLALGATSSSRIDGLKGITVCPEAPFTGASPQINVSYTGLDRAALINLFKSMPTVNASQVCNITGATGAADLTAEDLAIATNKGWSILR